MIASSSKMHVLGSFSCDKCDFVASQNSELAEHRNTEVCGMKNEGGIRIRNRFNSDQKFKCEVCEYVANTIINLKHHMAFVHKKGSFLCSKCDFVGAFPSELKHHEKKHGTFSCAHCSYVAMFKTDLKKHERYRHGAKNVHPCPECDYSATRADALKTHIDAIHLKIRYPCDLCEHASTTKSDLSKHKRLKHGISRT